MHFPGSATPVDRSNTLQPCVLPILLHIRGEFPSSSTSDYLQLVPIVEGQDTRLMPASVYIRSFVLNTYFLDRFLLGQRAPIVTDQVTPLTDVTISSVSLQLPRQSGSEAGVRAGLKLKSTLRSCLRDIATLLFPCRGYDSWTQVVTHIAHPIWRICVTSVHGLYQSRS